MGSSKNRSFKKSKSHKSKRKKVNDGISPKSKNNDIDGGYDIEASDDEIDEAPTKWYNEFSYVKLPRVELDTETIESLKQEAEMILEEETNNYKTCLSKCKKSETKWMMTVAKTGTSADKVAALALMVQNSPVHNISTLSSLINLAKVSKKHQFIVVLETVTELFVSDLLRPTKKLRNFHKQPLSHLSDLCENDAKLRRKRLCYWLFEDKLKALYEHFIKLLNTVAHDSVQSNREKAIASMMKLLLENREQEEVLIQNLINKLGDPVHKVASKVVYGLEKVVNKYSKMKILVLDETEKMLFRPHIAKRAQYYAICFLSQYKFTRSEQDLSKRLIALYFSFFKACVKTGDIDSRLMGALLVGVNRAFPFAQVNKKETVIPEEHIDTMFKVVHFAPFKISLQALALLLQITNSDRFYNALYKKLLDKELPQTSHQAIWLNLVLKAIRKDQNPNRKKSFVKRIFQICLHFPVPLLCGTLVMLSQIVKYLPDVADNFVCLKREIKNEDENEGKQFTSDVISNLKKFDDDEDENVGELQKPIASSWFHRDQPIANQSEVTIVDEKNFNDRKPPEEYDSNHRNPAFAGGEKASFVELISLKRHFHPTVSLFAEKILSGEKIYYTGDPLRDFTILHFLERFSFKNPKRSRTDKGEDKEELFRAVGSQRKHYNPTGMRALPVQSEKYLKQSENAVPVDELFLYKYLKTKQSKNGENTRKRKRDGDDSDADVSDVESVGSVEFNEYLDDLMKGSKGAKTLDFAEEIEVTKRNKGKRKEVESEEESEDDEDIGNDEMSEPENESDVEMSEIEDGSEDEISNFEDGSEMDEFSEQEDDRNVSRKRIGRNFGNEVVPTDEFSQILEEIGRYKSGGSQDVFNKDNSNRKQLKWEASRVKQRWRSKNSNQKTTKRYNKSSFRKKK